MQQCIIRYDITGTLPTNGIYITKLNCQRRFDEILSPDKNQTSDIISDYRRRIRYGRPCLCTRGLYQGRKSEPFHNDVNYQSAPYRRVKAEPGVGRFTFVREGGIGGVANCGRMPVFTAIPATGEGSGIAAKHYGDIDGYPAYHIYPGGDRNFVYVLIDNRTGMHFQNQRK